MTSCRILLAVASLASAAPAAEAGPRPEPSGQDMRHKQARTQNQAKTPDAAPIPLRWMPGWLVEALRNAIADATDPRDRHAER